MLRQTDIITASSKERALILMNLNPNPIIDITVSSIGRALILMNSNPNPITDITVSSIGRALILMNSNPNPITDITASSIGRALILMNSNPNPITDITFIIIIFFTFIPKIIIPSPTKLRKDIVTSFRNILVNTLESTSFNGF